MILTKLLNIKIKPIEKSPVLTLLTASFLILNACTGTPPSNTGETESTETTKTAVANNGDATVVIDFTDNVVIPTYKELVAKAGTLQTAVDAFVSDPNENSLKAAQEAWTETRFPWEQSEAFAFGPAESLGYDGDLDDWPVNETDVQAILESGDELTPEYIKGLQTTQKGFHTLELLLFGSNNDKTAGDFSERELALIKELSTAFNQTSQDLVISWESGIDGNPAYKEVLATAGDENNPAYLTVDAAVEEIVQGMIGCLDEVGNEKIGAPLEAKITDDLESRFSHTSLNDFKNNIISVQNAYLGQFAGSSGVSISTLVAAKDPALDEQVKSELQAALDAVDAVPSPIEPNITDEAALEKMEAAKTAVLTLFETVEGQVLPAIKN